MSEAVIKTIEDRLKQIDHYIKDHEKALRNAVVERDEYQRMVLLYSERIDELLKEQEQLKTFLGGNR